MVNKDIRRYTGDHWLWGKQRKRLSEEAGDGLQLLVLVALPKGLGLIGAHKW